jgi:protein-tyrosine-phosphatase
LVDNSDVVLLFEEKNIERFKEHFPDAAEKVFFLGDLKPEGDYEIEDPYGGDGSRFEEIYQQITASLDTLKYQA